MKHTLLTNIVALSLLAGCTTSNDLELVGTIQITIEAVDGVAPPGVEAPLDVPLPPLEVPWDFTAEYLDAEGNLESSFNGFARLSVVPGSVNGVTGPGASGRNIQFTNGRAEGTALVSGVFGPSRLWIEDIGYVPAPPGVTPICADGIDNDGDVPVDFPNDPGCAFGDDMSEEAGTLRTGVSPAVNYRVPTLAEVNGLGSATPYTAVAVDIATQSPSEVIVTRVSSDGFYVTDIGDANAAYNNIFAFNFNTPVGMRVCSKLSLLTGTASEFFGFTEINFPSYEVGRVDPLATEVCIKDVDCGTGEFCEKIGVFAREGICQACKVPAPVVLENIDLIDDPYLETLESGLVTIEQIRISPNLGPGIPEEVGDLVWAFTPGASNCDLNQDGAVDFFDLRESACSNQCAGDPECSDWLGFSSRGNFKGHRNDAMVLLNVSTAQGFNVLENRGNTLAYVTGVLRNFSGGSLNWTIETRCGDDLGCNFSEACVNVQGCLAGCDAADQGCIDECNAPRNPARACIAPATEDDNDAGTN